YRVSGARQEGQKESLKAAVCRPGCMKTIPDSGRIIIFWRSIDGRGRDEDFSSPTGSPGAVARPRLPQNVACGFPAPRSSAVGSQLSLLSVQVSFPWSADLLLKYRKLPLNGAHVAQEQFNYR